MDSAFLFWSIAAGIVRAAGYIPLAVFGSSSSTGAPVISGRQNVERPYNLVVHCGTEEQEKEVREYVKAQVKALSLKSKSVSPGCIELNYEVRFPEGESGVECDSEMDGVTDAHSTCFI